MRLLPAFTEGEKLRVKQALSGKVAVMMGRKFEEGDWSEVYCAAKGIPEAGWSSLNIDVTHDGLGVEFKMLRVARLGGRSIKSVCGTTLMHPSATRSIRIDNTELRANDVMQDVLEQYGRLLEDRTEKVRRGNTDGRADMRFGWVLWEQELKEFLYFEERMTIPDPMKYYAEWNETSPRGARKGSKSLWIYEKSTDRKRYSVTTSAGVKVQPYFDVPPPNDVHLNYFRVQSERIDADTIVLWVSEATAERLRQQLGGIDKQLVSEAIISVAETGWRDEAGTFEVITQAKPVQVTNEAFEIAMQKWGGVSDDHCVQLLIKALEYG